MMIDPLYFLIAFCIGLFYTYISQPNIELVTKYPTLYNDLTYVDDAGVCYKYQVVETPCPNDGKVYNPLTTSTTDAPQPRAY
jgi:hypothetical protein